MIKKSADKGFSPVFISVLFVLTAMALLFPFATSSHAITISGSETVTTNSNATYTATGCSGSVSWSVTGTGTSISSNGVLTTGTASCGGITVTARCSDGSIATKTVRVTNAGQWVLVNSINNACYADYTADLTCISGKTKIVYFVNRQSNGLCKDGCPSINWGGCPILQYSCAVPSNCVFGADYAFIGNAYCLHVKLESHYEWQCPSCTNGQTISCYSGASETNGVGLCKAGTQTCVNRQWGACEGEVLPTQEVCGDNLDNNCDGQVDEGCCEVSVKVSPPEVRPKKTGNDAKTKSTITVQLTKPAPTGGCTVRLEVKPVNYTGGHSHNSTKPTGSLDYNVIIFLEGTNGSEEVKYTSSEVAGEEKIKIKVNDKDTGEETIKVMVTGFAELGEGDGYALIGQTNTHPKNHYGTGNTLFSLLDVADAYYEEYNGTLRINDISLEWGGLFDWDVAKTPWRPPHKSHRAGKNMDVDDVTGEGKKITKGLLDKLIITNGFNISVLDEGNHFHLTFP